MKKQPKIGQGNSIAKNLTKCLMIFILLSCKKENEIIIPDQVRTEYNAFLSEAQKRGIKLNLHHVKRIYLQAQITEKQCPSSNGSNVGGYYDHHKKTIFIDTTNFYYQEDKEMLLFHELGHGLLGRVHRNECFADDLTPVSIMNVSTPIYFNEYTLYKRQYYVDELFNQHTSYPSWAK